MSLEQTPRQNSDGICTSRLGRTYKAFSTNYTYAFKILISRERRNLAELTTYTTCQDHYCRGSRIFNATTFHASLSPISLSAMPLRQSGTVCLYPSFPTINSLWLLLNADVKLLFIVLLFLAMLRATVSMFTCLQLFTRE